MANRSKAQIDALKALGNPKVLAEYDDGSIDFTFEGQKLAMGPNATVMSPAEYITKVYRPWQAKQKKEPKKPKEPAGKKKTTLSYFGIGSGTPCERKPELCTPRNIKHIAWDADDTIWDIKPYGIASNITGPLRLLDPDTVVEERPSYKTPTQQPLAPSSEVQDYKYGHRYGHKFGYPAEEEPEDFFLRQIDKNIGKGEPSETSLEVSQIMTELTEELTQEEKDKLGLVGQDVQLITKTEVPPKEPGKKDKTNFHEPGKIYIKLMPGYRDLLDRLKEQGVTNSIISLNTKGTVSRILEKFGIADHYLDIRDSWENKGKVFKDQMKNFGYKPQEAMFVDNTQSHVEDVAKSGAVPLVYGKDIKDVAQIVNYMTNAPEKINT